ncbi:MAG: thioredoxin family protein [bacterium]|nr:thioredoxin family protein [bacterium]
MKKNFIIILAILFLPLFLYGVLSKNRMPASLPSIATNGPEIIKFSSPMCYECQELEKIFDEVYPNYSSKVNLTKIDVTNRDKSTQQLIKEYNVTLVPTCIFKDANGNILRKTEGAIQPKILENYIKEQING